MKENPLKICLEHLDKGMGGSKRKSKEHYAVVSDCQSSLRNHLAVSHKELIGLYDLVMPLSASSLQSKNAMELSLSFVTDEKNVLIILRKPFLPSGENTLKIKKGRNARTKESS